MSVTQELQDMTEDYIREFGVEVIDLDAVSEWAVQTGRYQREPISLVKQCKQDLARALRTQHVRDPQGRDARKWHAVHVTSGAEQLVLWADIGRARPNHMRISLQQRRQSILGACKQHKLDTDSYNDNNNFNSTLSLFDYDFNKDLEELALPAEYPDPDPDGSDDDTPDTVH